MLNNPVIDLMIRIKNGYMSKKEQIEVPYSKFKDEVLKKLVALKYIKDYSIEGDKIKTVLINLSYDQGYAAMTGLKIFSKPGSRWYTKTKELKPVLSGMGYSFISTPKGILTNIEAKKEKVGGELLFEIW